MSEPRSFRFARNISWTLLAQVVLAALNLLITPVIVRRLGLEPYGLYILLQTVAGYLMLCSLGAGSAAVRYISLYMGRGEGRGALDAARYAYLFHGLGVLAGSCALVAFAPFVLGRVARLPPDFIGDGLFVLRCAAAGAVLMGLAQAASQVLQGLQRFDAQSAVAMAQSGLALTAAAAAAGAGYGVRGVAAGWVLAQGAAALLAGVLAWRGLRAPRLLPAGEPLAAKPFARWGLSQWLGPLAWIVVYQFDKVFIARSASLTSLTLYAVPANLLQRLQAFPGIVSAVLAPMMTELQDHQAEESLRRIYLKSVRLVLWALLPPLALLFALMPQFLSLWLGGEFGGMSVWPARLLVFSQLFWLLGTMPGTVVFARDRPWYMPMYSWAQAIVSLLAWRLLIPRWQLLGAAAGSLLAQAVPVGFFLAVVHARVLKLSWEDYARQGLLIPGMSAALALGAVFPFHDAATTWARLIAMAGGGALIFYSSAWLLMGEQDRGVFLRYLRLERGTGTV